MATQQDEATTTHITRELVPKMPVSTACQSLTHLQQCSETGEESVTWKNTREVVSSAEGMTR